MGIQVQPWCCRKWYALTYGGWLLDFDPDSVVLSNPRNTGLRAAYDRGFTLQFNPRDASLYTIVWTAPPANQAPALYRVALDGAVQLAAIGHCADPAAELYEVVTENAGLAIDGNGTMLAVTLTKLTGFLLTLHAYTFDPGGLLTRLPQQASEHYKALDYDDDGTLWAYSADAPDTLHTINPATGLSTPVGPKLQHTGGGPAGMAFDAGRLYLLAGAGNVGFEYYEIASDTRVVLADPAWPAELLDDDGHPVDVVAGLAIDA